MCVPHAWPPASTRRLLGLCHCSRARRSQLTCPAAAARVAAVDGDFDPREVYVDFLQSRVRDADDGVLVATVSGQSVRSQLFEGEEGCLHACLSDLLQDEGEVYFSATFAAGDALVSLLPEHPAAPAWVLATSVGASRSPELLRIEGLDDLTAALEVATGVTEQLPQGSSPCVVYTFVHCQAARQSVTPYSFIDIGWNPEGSPPLAESLELLNCVVALCLERPPPAYSEEHAVVQFLRETGVQGEPLCLVAVGETSSPERVADMALLLEGIAPKSAAAPSHGLFGGPKPVSPSLSTARARSPFQATNGNAKLSVPNADYMDYLEQRALSPPSGAKGRPPVSPGLFGTWQESPKQKSDAAEPLSQMNVSATTDSVAAFAESHGGNLLKRITQELGKCNDELRSKENAHVELARTKAVAEEVRRENIALRKRVHNLVATQQRREMERWCFHALHVNAEKARAAREGVQAYKQMFAARWVIRRHAVHSFVAWKALMYRSRKLRSFVMRLQNVAGARAFSAWRDAVSSNKAVRHRLNKVVQRFSKSGLARGFGAWRAWTSENRATRRVLMKAGCRLRNRTIDVSFTTWHENIMWIHRARETVGRVSARMLNRGTAMALATWQDSVAWIKRARAVVLKVANRITQGLAYPAFRTWAEWAGTKRRQTNVVGKSISRMLQRRAAASFDSWRYATSESISNRVIVTRALTRILKRTMAGAFYAWASNTHELVHVKTLMGRVTSRMLNHTLGGAFSRWAEFAVEHSHNSTLLSKIVPKFAMAKLSAAFSGWVDAHASNGTSRRLLVRCVQRMQRKKKWGAFLAWQAAAEQLKCRRVALDRAVRKLIKGVMAAAFAGWSTRHFEMKRQLDICARCVQRIARSHVAGAYDAWREYTVSLANQRLSAEKGILRMKNRLTAAAWAGWVDGIAFNKAKRELLSKAVKRIQLVAVGSAFSGWLDAHNQKQYRKTLLTQVVRKISNLQLSAACSKWSSWSKEVSAHRQLVARTLARMMNRAVQCALDGWIHFHRTAKQRKVTLQRCLAKMEHGALAASWYSWVDNVRSGIRARRMAAKAASMLMNRMLKLPFVRWSKQVAETKRMKHLAQQAMKKFVNRALLGPFSGWQANTKTKKRLVHAAAQCVKRMRLARLQQIVSTWRDTTRKQSRLKRAAFKIVKRLKLGALHQSFAGWNHAVQQVFAHKRLLERMILRMYNRVIAGCFMRWLAEVKSLATHRTGIARTLARMNNRFILTAFGAWDTHTKEKVRLRFVARKCIGKLSHQAMSAAFEAWSETVAGILSAKRNCLVAWHQLVQEKQVSKAIMYKVVVRLNQRCAAGAFDTWSQWAEALKTNRQTLAICLKRMTRKALHSAFAAWSAFTSDVVCTRVVVRKCLSRLMKRALFSSFCAWRMTCVDRKQMRVVLTRVVVRMQRLALRIALDAWRAMHQQRIVVKNRAAARMFSNLLQYFQSWGHLIREIAAQGQAQIDSYCTAISHPRRLKICIRYWQAEVERAHQLKQSAIAIGFAGTLQAAYMRWSSGFKQRKHELWLLKRAGQRLVNQKAIIVIERWADYTAERKELRGKADLALRAIKMQGVRSAFRTWADFWREAVATRNALVKQQCRRFLHQTEMKVLRRWAELCETKRRLRSKMELLVGRSAKTLTNNAFYKWVDVVAARKFLLVRMQKAHTYFQRETLKHIRLTFYTWTFSCMGSRALRYASGRKFDRRVARIRICQALDGWKKLHAQMVKERRNELLMQRSVKKLFHRQVILAWDCWCRFYAMRKDLRAHLAVKIGRQVQGKAASALERWVMLMQHEKAVRLLLARRMVRLHARMVRWAVKQLKAAVADKKRLDKVKRSCVIRFTKMAMKLGFDAWATTHKREMTVRRRAVAKTLSNILYYYEKWATVCARLHQERELMLERYELKLRVPTIRKTMYLWRKTVQHIKEAVGTAIELGFAGSLRGAMMTWTRGFQQRKHELWLLRRAGQRLINQRAIIILDRWCDYTNERKELRQKAETVLINLKMQHVRSAFRSWSGFWRENVTRRNTLATQQCRFFLHRAEMKCFARWKELCEDKRRLRYKLELLMGRCSTTLMADMFFSWSDTVSSEKFVKQRMAKAHQYYAREVVKQIRANFRHWVMMTWGAKALVEVSGRKFFRRVGVVRQRNAFHSWTEVHSQIREEKRKEALMARCMKKIFHKRTLLAFDCWTDFYEWRKQLREQLRQRIGRQIQGKVANSFQRWSMMTVHEKEVRILLERRQVRLHGRIQRWVLRVWIDTMVKQKQLVRVQSQAVILLTKRAMKLGFDKWAVTHKREMIVRRRAVAKTLSNVLYYFDNWAKVCEKLHNEREAMLQRYFIKFKPQIMRNVLCVWFDTVQIAKDIKTSTIALGFSSSLRGAFMKWTSGFHQRQHELRLLQRAGARLKNQKAMIIIDRWCDYTYERNELRQQANAALVGIRMRGVRSAFRTWADFWHEAVTAREATVKLHCRRLLHQSEAKAFIRWSELCATKRALRYKLELLVGRSHKTLMQDMFDSWAIAFDQAALVRGRLLKAQTHFARQLLRFCKACFMEWAALMNSKAKMRNDALRKTVNKWSGKVLGYHFGHWAGLCARRRRINRALANVRMRVAGDLLSLVRLIFSEWAKVSDSSSRLRQMQVATVRRRLAKLLYGNCFKRWAMHSSAKVQALSAHIGSSNGTLLRKSFRQWVEALEEKHKHFDSVRHHVAQLVERQYRWVWNMWVCEHQAVNRRYYTLVRGAASVIRKHRVRCALRRWRGEVGGKTRVGKAPKVLLAQSFSAWADWWWQQAWVKRLLDVNTKNCNSRTQSALALRLWSAQQQLAQKSRQSGPGDEDEVALLRATNAELRAEMDGILGFMNSDDAKPKTVQEHAGSALTSLSALSAFNSAAGAAASRGAARSQTAEGRAEMAAEKARVVAHLELLERRRENRVASGGSVSPTARENSPEASGGTSPRAAGGWAMMRNKGKPKKSATGLDLAALRKAAAEQEELDARNAAGAGSAVADASSFSTMLSSFDFGTK